MELHPATYEDFVAVQGEPPPFSFRGIVARDNGEAVAIAGVYNARGQNIVFTHFRRRISKRLVLKAWPIIRSIMESKRAPVYAFRDSSYETSRSMLMHFGFKPFSEGPEGEIYKWQ